MSLGARMGSSSASRAPAVRAERIATLRELIRQRDAAPAPATGAALPSGWAALDAILPAGGLPLGGDCEVIGPLGSGKVSLLLGSFAHALSQGEGAAWVSARGPLFADPLAQGGVVPEHVLQVCPRDPTRVAWAAEQILRSGRVRLLLLDGMDPAGGLALAAAAFHRLAGAARASQAALVILLEPSLALAAIPRSPALRLSVAPLVGYAGGCNPPLLAGLGCHTDAPPPPDAPPAPSADPFSWARATSHRRLEVTLLAGRGVCVGGQACLDLPGVTPS